MKEIFKIIKANFILLFGTGLFIYGLFSFDSGYYLGKTGLSFELGTHSYPITTYYYYSDITKILLVGGVILIVIGLSKLRKERD